MPQFHRVFQFRTQRTARRWISRSGVPCAGSLASWPTTDPRDSSTVFDALITYSQSTAHCATRQDFSRYRCTSLIVQTLPGREVLLSAASSFIDIELERHSCPGAASKPRLNPESLTLDRGSCSLVLLPCSLTRLRGLFFFVLPSSSSSTIEPAQTCPFRLCM